MHSKSLPKYQSYLFQELLSDAAKSKKEQFAIKYGVKEDYLIACYLDL